MSMNPEEFRLYLQECASQIEVELDTDLDKKQVDDVIQALRTNKFLRKLSIHKIYLQHRNFANSNYIGIAVAAISNSSLQELVLNGVGNCGEITTIAKALQHNTSLEKLTLYTPERALQKGKESADRIPTQDLALYLEENHSLKSLTIGNSTWILPGNLDDLRNLSKMAQKAHSLEELTLVDSHFPAPGLELLTATLVEKKNFKKLCFVNVNFDHKSYVYLGELLNKNVPFLQELHLGKCKINVAAFQVIAEGLKDNSNLTSLSLPHCPLEMGQILFEVLKHNFTIVHIEFSCDNQQLQYHILSSNQKQYNQKNPFL